MSGQIHVSHRQSSASGPIRLAALAVVAIAGGLVTACGGSSGNPATSSQPAGGGSGTTSSGGGGSINDGIGHPVSVCTLLPAATAASMSGLPITVATEGDTPSYKIYSCDYTSADGTQGFDVDVLGLDAAAGYGADLGASPSSQPVSGLGDKAFETGNGVQALFGNVDYKVANLANASASEAMIKYLQPKV
jgi:hypothetical protein